MCGRSACTLGPDAICRSLGPDLGAKWRDGPGNAYRPSYNIAPSMHSPVMFRGSQLTKMAGEQPGAEYLVQPMMWGTVPHYHKGSDCKGFGFKTNNCRLETVQEKPLYNHLLSKGQRCVVLCEGFYEWQKTPSGGKNTFFVTAEQPKHIKIWDKSTWSSETNSVNTENNSAVKQEETCLEAGKENQDAKVLQDDTKCFEDTKIEPKTSEDENVNYSDGPKLLQMAGLFGRWESTEGHEVWHYTVLTQASGGPFKSIHHRVPCVLEGEESVRNWLDEKQPIARISFGEPVSWYRVSPHVNTTANDDSRCLMPLQEARKKPANSIMSAWLTKGKRKLENDEEANTKAAKTDRV